MNTLAPDLSSAAAGGETPGADITSGPPVSSNAAAETTTTERRATMAPPLGGQHRCRSLRPPAHRTARTVRRRFRAEQPEDVGRASGVRPYPGDLPELDPHRSAAGQLGPHPATATARDPHLEPTTERLDPVGEPAQTRARVQGRAADPVVHDLHDHTGQ